MELVQIIANDAIVKASEKKKGVVPSWMGGRFAISPDLGIAIRHSFKSIHKTVGISPEIKFLKPLFKEQEQLSALPKEDELLVEYIQSKYGYHLFFYPFEGKLVHEGMAQVVAYRLSLLKPATFSIATNEYGIELLSETDYEIDTALLKQIFSPQNLHKDINSGINFQ